jgi:hypothetical protein
MVLIARPVFVFDIFCGLVLRAGQGGGLSTPIADAPWKELWLIAVACREFVTVVGKC